VFERTRVVCVRASACQRLIRYTRLWASELLKRGAGIARYKNSYCVSCNDQSIGWNDKPAFCNSRGQPEKNRDNECVCDCDSGFSGDKCEISDPCNGKSACTFQHSLQPPFHSPVC
jgi:hypothetical protein